MISSIINGMWFINFILLIESGSKIIKFEMTDLNLKLIIKILFVTIYIIHFDFHVQ